MEGWPVLSYTKANLADALMKETLAVDGHFLTTSGFLLLLKKTEFLKH